MYKANMGMHMHETCSPVQVTKFPQHCFAMHYYEYWSADMPNFILKHSCIRVLYMQEIVLYVVLL